MRCVCDCGNRILSQFLLVAFSGRCALSACHLEEATLFLGNLLTCDLLFEFGLNWRLSPYAELNACLYAEYA